MKYAMVIDMRRCIGCASCVVACKTTNNVPYGVNGSRMEYEEVGTFPKTHIERTPMLCMQCDNPPCVPVCPTEATYKDSEGIVRVDQDKCIGDGACTAECPYGARTLLETAPESYFPGMARNAQEKLQEETFKKNKVSKCEFCYTRLEEGKAPA